MKYEQFLADAVRAPSGDNCQPWRFEISGERIHIFNLPDEDTSLYNFEQGASLVAHGALIENLAISASHYGYIARPELFPDPARPDLVAAVSITPAPPQKDTLQPFIGSRTTNRRLYDGKPLDPHSRQALVRSVGNGLGCSLFLTEAAQEKKILCDTIGLNDRLVFEIRGLHSFLFDHMRWTVEEAERTADGLDLRSLELSFPDSLMFPLLKNWALVEILNRFGVSKIIGANARKLAGSAAAIGVITAIGDTPSDYISAGRCLERIWLEATRQELSFQMMTGITFLMGRFAAGRTDGFTSEQVDMVLSARDKIERMTGGGAGPMLIFRVGHCSDPSVRSLRHDLASHVVVRE